MRWVVASVSLFGDDLFCISSGRPKMLSKVSWRRVAWRANRRPIDVSVFLRPSQQNSYCAPNYNTYCISSSLLRLFWRMWYFCDFMNGELSIWARATSKHRKFFHIQPDWREMQRQTLFSDNKSESVFSIKRAATMKTSWTVALAVWCGNNWVSLI